MPVSYNLPYQEGLWNQEDINLYNKLPFYLANLEAKYLPQYKTWEKLVGKIKWQPNMGTTMKGVRAEPTPIARSTFFPLAITTASRKDVMYPLETTESAIVYRHKFESPQINFNPSFQDFRQNQIQYAMKDMMQQIAFAQDCFIRTNIFYKSPFVFISGKPFSNANDGFDGNELVSAPIEIGNDAGDAAGSKTTAWLQAAVSYIGNGGDVGSLSYKVLCKVQTVLCEDLQAPAYEGQGMSPEDNQVMKGKWLCIGSNEAWQSLRFDNFVLANRPLNMNLLNSSFTGIVSENVIFRAERFPIRIAADGTMPGAQTYETNPNAWNYGMTVANPAYVNAPFEVAFLIGSEPYRAIQVGAPPAPFASGKMGADEFERLEWNGEVRVTGDILLNLPGNNLDTNKYGEFVQLISSCVFGIIPVNRRYVIPILFRRRRVQTQ